MTGKQAKEFIDKYKGAMNFVKPSHLEELSPLFEVHIEAIPVRKDEFHDLKGSYMPRKETLDKFAQAAGVSFNTTAEATRKEGDGCYIGTAQAMVMGPDGKWIIGPICEYEFDCDVRLEEMRLAGKKEYQGPVREYTQKELDIERVQFRKVARQRANTGARNRATLAVLGMQTGFKDLFPKNVGADAVKVFLFSRIIVNAKNELVLNRMLDGIAGPTQALFGPQVTVPQISAPVQPAEYVGQDIPEDPPMRPADEQRTTPASLAAAALDDGFELDGSPSGTPDPRSEAITTLEEYLASGALNANAENTIRGLIDSNATPIETLQLYVKKCSAIAGKKTA
jgi:hypothetical protein